MNYIAKLRLITKEATCPKCGVHGLMKVTYPQLVPVSCSTCFQFDAEREAKEIIERMVK